MNLGLFYLYLGCGSTEPEDKESHNTFTDEVVPTEPSIESEDSGTEATSTEQDAYQSERSSVLEQQFGFAPEVTLGNPLKGFLTSYLWGEPANELSHSLEFVYVPLADLIQAPEEYSFDTGLEPHLTAAEERGNHLLLRVYLDYPSLGSGLPSYLDDLVDCNPYNDYGGGCSPDYSDPELQAALLGFVEKLGELYDGDRRIAFIQLGLIGFWGEWHTYPHNEWFADDAFQQELITKFDDSFQYTGLQIRYPIQDVVTRDIGFHDDSFAYSTLGDIEWFFWPKMVSAGGAERWQTTPMGGEVAPALQTEVLAAAYETGEYSQDLLDCISETHTSYLLNYQAFNHNGQGYSGDQLAAAEQANQLMGYTYHLPSVNLTVGKLNGNTIDAELQITVENRGVAPFYYPLSLQVDGVGTGEQWTVLENLESVLPNTSVTASLSLESISVEQLSTGFSLSLSSPMLLDSQFIRFANMEQENGAIKLQFDLTCTHDTDELQLGEFMTMNGATCFCDVDGQFYDVQGESCQ